MKESLFLFTMIYIILVLLTIVNKISITKLNLCIIKIINLNRNGFDWLIINYLEHFFAHHLQYGCKDQ